MLELGGEEVGKHVGDTLWDHVHALRGKRGRVGGAVVMMEAISWDNNKR